MKRAAENGFLVAGVCFLGSWAVYCYAMMLSASSFSGLKTWSFVPVVIALGVWAVCMGKLVTADVGQASGVTAPVFTSSSNSGLVWALLVVAVFVVTMHIFDIHYWSVWILLLCASILVFRTVLISPAMYSELSVSRSNLQRVGIGTLILFGIILVAVTHRPDPDDAQYLNFVVTAMDFPFESLFSHSGLWQDPNVPLESAIYRFHTYELLVAALSDVFGIDHKTVYYLILAPIFGGIAILVHWRLAQYLLPQYAFLVLLTWLFLVLVLGDSHREFGNFAFVRLYQGKA